MFTFIIFGVTNVHIRRRRKSTFIYKNYDQNPLDMLTILKYLVDRCINDNLSNGGKVSAVHENTDGVCGVLTKIDMLSFYRSNNSILCQKSGSVTSLEPIGPIGISGASCFTHIIWCSLLNRTFIIYVHLLNLSSLDYIWSLFF